MIKKKKKKKKKKNKKNPNLKEISIIQGSKSSQVNRLELDR